MNGVKYEQVSWFWPNLAVTRGGLCVWSWSCVNVGPYEAASQSSRGQSTHNWSTKFQLNSWHRQTTVLLTLCRRRQTLIDRPRRDVTPAWTTAAGPIRHAKEPSILVFDSVRVLCKYQTFGFRSGSVLDSFFQGTSTFWRSIALNHRSLITKKLQVVLL